MPALLLATASTMFLALLLTASLAEPVAPSLTDQPPDATVVAVALEAASATRGEALIVEYACSVCHITGGGRVAPSFAGIADRAASRRLHMSAGQYLFESIVQPGAYLVAGYANAMPSNFAKRLSQAEIGHIIAYLLTLSVPEGSS
ncbi:MAG: cytochrome c [Chloroflexi bacterium]|nr:cytochrome c [Chloroflexota bacterium]MCY4247104.1 cytochrome c [Chloroflexota bacterium]